MNGQQMTTNTKDTTATDTVGMIALLTRAVNEKLEATIAWSNGTSYRGVPSLGGLKGSWIVNHRGIMPGLEDGRGRSVTLHEPHPAPPACLVAEGKDWAGIRSLLERAECEGLEVTLESPAKGTRIGVPSLGRWNGGEPYWVRMPGGHPGEGGIWLPDSWARETAAPNENTVSRVTLLHKPAVANVEHVARPVRLPCHDCHGLGVLHTPTWMGTRPCRCAAPVSLPDQPWSVEHNAKDTNPLIRWWMANADFAGVYVSISFRTVIERGGTSVFYGGLGAAGASTPGFAASEKLGRMLDSLLLPHEQCHEMAAARVLDVLRAEFPNGVG